MVIGLGAVVLGSGAGLYVGFLRPGGTHAPSASSLVPDIATVDPCGLAATAAFDGLSAPTADSNGSVIPPEHLRQEARALNFNKCEVVVNGVKVEVNYDSAVPTAELAPDRFTLSSQGRLRIAKEKRPASASQCQQYVYLDNGTGVTVTARANGLVVDRMGRPVAGVDVCGTADRVTSAVLTTVKSRRPPRIHYPPDSLGSFDPCGMLGLAVADALRNPHGDISEGGHGCIWGTVGGFDSPRADLRLTLEKPDSWRALLKQPAFGGSRATIAGRDSIVMHPMLDVPALYCSVETAGKTWDPWPGFQIPERPVIPGAAPATRSLTEIVEITVFLPSGTVEQACQRAQAFAAKLWPTLPRPA
ncbi:hypothetical protein IPZ58_25165 [Streptomyces roseoverticillatus]|uniref:hypothetical protein n=1 Tax=Streptomyces roseoverticillatus TaxID=66429 RepID=UPI001F1EFB4B|nr:hypothetical protein [Streptomyces roseoverticillatus]MCF3104857.1 hypothetical protein [Streptomyces roseoverticillatus]